MPDASAAAPVLVPMSPGELVDRVTILELKAARIADAGKVANVRRELHALRAAGAAPLAAAAGARVVDELRAVNAVLWEVEDALRACERAQDFGPGFVRLARAVYRLNDRRAALKRAINERLGSPLLEEKSYAGAE
jgi:hypothetical protein